ncbi:MAG: UvrD-helicase domain-containing protein, partial [Deltaproteobacteria bacterium]|nr:UvrD-helicase domain-containing protein [Deltaproteobacteria bacterium]
ALIDEFQDTDEMQWNIFHRLFGGGEHYLYLIGDPKQAIYGFRGANINVYLKARDTADTQYTMRRNFRSDAAYVGAMNHLLDWNGIFGDDAIRYVNVEAKNREVPRRVRFGDDLPDPALSLTLFDHTMLAPDPKRDTSKPVGRGDVVKTLPHVVASEIVALLERKPEIYNEKTGSWRKIHPGDLAVLVRSNKQATAIHEAIQAVDLPAVVARVGDVFQSEEAEVLSWWLAAIARPNSDLRAKRLVTSLLFQWTASDLETVDPMHWENWISLLSAWQKDFAAQGFMRTFRRLLDTVWGETPATERTISTRLLSQVGGERSLTNLYHLAELLHDAATNGRLGLEGLITWLEQQRAEEHKDNEALEMRLETDAQAVQISTMHKSKGLQYPFVWAPYLWDGNLIMPGETSMLVAPDLDCKEGTTRTLNIQLGKDSEPKASQLALAKKERISESLRLLYVTLTRAELYCKVYWGNISRNLETNAMGSVLYGASPLPADEHEARELREASANRVETAGKFIKSKKSDFWPHLNQLAQTSGDTIVAEIAQRPTNRLAPTIEQEDLDLHLAAFTRSGIDHLWAQSSYSGLTRHKLAADPLELKVVDEDTVAADYDDGSIGTSMLESLGLPEAIHTDEDTPDVPLGAMRGGAQAGEFFHKVYELIDFDLGKPERDNPETHAALMEVITKCLHSYALSEELWSDDLTAAFLETLRTPLGGPLGTLRLCDIPMNHRLDELQFDFP